MEEVNNTQEDMIVESNETTVSADSAVQEKLESNDLIAGKFKSQDDLVKAYQELQTKLGGDAVEETSEAVVTEDVTPTVDAIPGLSNDDYTSYSNEWAESGELSEESYTKLQEAGFSKDIVDAHIQGNVASSVLQETELLKAVGGKEEFNKMAEWARGSLPQEDINAFNNINENGTTQEVQLALLGLKSNYEEANGRTPNLTAGVQSGLPTDVFESSAQVSTAINNPLYQSDPAYRKNVIDKLNRSKKL